MPVNANGYLVSKEDAMNFEPLNKEDHWREETTADLIRGIIIFLAILVEMPIIPVFVKMVVGIPAKTLMLIFGFFQIHDALKEFRRHSKK